MKLLNKIMFWKKNIKIKPEIKEADDYESPLKNIKNNTYIPVINDLKIINFIDKDKPNILLMDDFSSMVDLLSNELQRIPNMNVYDEFNIYAATEEFAAFQVEKYLNDKFKKCFDIAILDITLGGIINGEELDGVDIAIEIKKCNPDCKIKFITGHTLNQRNPEIFNFSQKFKNYTDLNIDETIDIIDCYGDSQQIYKHIIGKNDNRIILMEHLISDYYKNKD